MKTIPIQITKDEYEWLSKTAVQQKTTVAKIIEAMVREAYLYKGEEVPAYEWGEAGIPPGKPVKYDPQAGLVILDEGEK